MNFIHAVDYLHMSMSIYFVTLILIFHIVVVDIRSYMIIGFYTVSFPLFETKR